MATERYKIFIYDPTTDILITEFTGTDGDGGTVGDLVVNVGYEISQTKFGPILNHSLKLQNDLLSPVYKYVEPQAETITGFYLDGTEYKFGGGGASYTAGTGIDITNNEIGLDGTYEGTIQDYSAIQGPAPDGFHIPLITEWQGVKTIMDGLGLTTSNKWKINLHMPFTGARHYYSSESMQQGSIGYYWSSSPYSTSKVTILYLYGDDAVENRYDNRAMGFSVRCFKDSYIAPDSSWTVIQGTLGSAGIFRNQTNGIISITDGIAGYTIQDKNLGATTVYNNGNTVSEANCGKYYQWGNNYGFPFTGTVTISSTKVNAESYGPGNYYSSSTFIKGDFDWSSVHNDNLRGGVTGIQTITNSGSLLVGDKLYKIVTSTTAPASGTASNVITIVTD